MTRGRILVAVFAVVASGAAGSAICHAKPPAKPVAPREPVSSETAAPKKDAPAVEEAPKVKVERGMGGKKIYRITEEIRIEGKIQKPEAFFFYQKSSINYDWQELKQDFVPRILDSVNRSPF